MGAFLVALMFFGMVMIASTAIIYSDGMGSQIGKVSPVPVLIGGMIFSAMIAFSHWVPHLGW